MRLYDDGSLRCGKGPEDEELAFAIYLSPTKVQADKVAKANGFVDETQAVDWLTDRTDTWTASS